MFTGVKGGSGQGAEVKPWAQYRRSFRTQLADYRETPNIIASIISPFNSMYIYMEPLYKGQVGDRSFVPWREVVLFSEVKNVLYLWVVEYNLFFVQRLSSSRR